MLSDLAPATFSVRLDARFTPTDLVQYTAVDGEVILIDLNQERFFGLNEAGASLWLRLSEGLPLRAVLDQLQEEFDVAPEVLQADVNGILSLWLQRGWIAEADATGVRRA